MLETFRAIAQLLPEPLLLVSRDGLVLAANQAASERFGAPRLEQLPLADFVSAEGGVPEFLARCARSTAPHAGVLVDRRRGERLRCEGARFPELGAARVVLRLAPERPGNFALLTQKLEELNREVLQRREAEAQRERLIEELARAVRLSELFVAVLGHDLRSPLGAVTAGTALALREAEEPRVRGHLERVARSARRMARMVDQLLDLTRVRLGRGLALQRTPTDLGELVQQAVAETEPVFRQHRLEVEGAGRCLGEWDRDRLAQVLSNLLVNACQHSGPGSVVTVRVEADEGRARVAVHNGGPPIPADVLPTLFDAFSGSPGSQGLGLGLYIAREVARVHGGELACTSSAADGTTFTLTLPLAPPVRFDGRLGTSGGLLERDGEVPDRAADPSMSQTS